MNPLKRNAANFSQEVKIEKFVSNAANAKSTLERNIEKNSLCVLIVLDLVTIECFKYYFNCY